MALRKLDFWFHNYASKLGETLRYNNSKTSSLKTTADQSVASIESVAGFFSGTRLATAVSGPKIVLGRNSLVRACRGFRVIGF